MSHRGMKVKSQLEESMAFQMRAFAMPQPVREYQFDEERRWRFDFAWPNLKVALECEGGVWHGGRHTRGQGFVDDCEKYTVAAAVHGWLVLRVTAEHIKSGEAITWIQTALRAKEAA